MARRPFRALRVVVATISLATGPGAMAGCAMGAASSAPSAKLAVVAAEDFWGSLARQLGGDRVVVHSLIANPATDPHDYEPTPADARAVAASQVVISNGIGYDPWIDKLIAANQSSRR